MFVEADMPPLADMAAREVELWQQDAEAERPVTGQTTPPAAPVAAVSELFQMPSTDLPPSVSARRSVGNTTGLSSTSIAAKLQRIRSVVAANVATLPASEMPGFEDLETDDLTDEVAPVPSVEQVGAAHDEDSGLRSDPDAALATVLDAPSDDSGGYAEHAREPAITGALASELPDDEDDMPEHAPEYAFEDHATGMFVADTEQETDNADHDPSWETADKDDTDKEPRPASWSSPTEAVDVSTEAETAFTSAPMAAPLGVSQDDLDAAARLTRGRGAPRPDAFRPESERHTQETASPGSAEEAEEPVETDPVEAPSEIAGDALVDRLLARSEGALQDDTTQRRQSALSHLKAAVAATLADRLGSRHADQDVPGPDTDRSYRADLAALVASETASASEPGESNIAPLVLRPQARIDADGAPGVVRPRRITRSELNAQDSTRAQDSGFAEYADAVGATELQDLLEAAAAYLSTVEGKTHFSRPEVMHMVMRHDSDHAFSREASLRSFGDLLRNGTIAKIDRGQFVISTESRYVANG
jgi:hypothetical protein